MIQDGNGDIISCDWRNIVNNDEGGLIRLNQVGSNRYGFDANKARDDFLDYFNSEEGSVSWQLQHIRDMGRINMPSSAV